MNEFDPKLAAQIADVIRRQCRQYRQAADVIRRASNRGVPAPRETMNRGPRFRATSGDSGVAEIMIYDEIGARGTSAQAVANELQSIKAATIEVRINSPGGDVFDAVAIYNALRNHGSKIITKIDGLAASAASVIAMAGEEIEMGPGTFLMIHEAWSVCAGPADELRKTADMLDQVCESIAQTYSTRAGKTVDYFKGKMSAETWYSAADAVAEGLADRIGSDEGADPEVENSFDLSRFKNLPAALRDREARELAMLGRQYLRNMQRIFRR